MITVYFADTGEIWGNMSVPAGFEASACVDGQSWIANDTNDPINGDFYYVFGGEVINRPSLDYIVSKTEISANAVDVVTISQVPSGAAVFISGTQYTTDGSDIEFVTDKQGKHIIKIDAFPYLPVEIEINAN